MAGQNLLGQAGAGTGHSEDENRSIVGLAAERIARLLGQLADEGLTTGQKAELEILLLTCWQRDLGFDDRSLADACRRIRTSGQLGRAFGNLESWLHDPDRAVALEELLKDLAPSVSDGKPHTREHRLR